MVIEPSVRDKAFQMMKALRITIAATVGDWEGHEAPEFDPNMWTLLATRMEQLATDADTVAEWARFQRGEIAEGRTAQ